MKLLLTITKHDVADTRFMLRGFRSWCEQFQCSDNPGHMYKIPKLAHDGIGGNQTVIPTFLKEAMDVQRIREDREKSNQDWEECMWGINRIPQPSEGLMDLG